MTDAVIRAADPDEDAEACAGIYAPYVTASAASFETEAPDRVEMRRRIVTSHAWLVAEDAGAVVGYAYGARHRERAAYRWAVDAAVYVSAPQHGRGVGRALYSELFALLRGGGFWTVCAGITMPNDASEGLHRAMGFQAVGVYRRIGFKAGAWHDVGWWQLDLRPGDAGAPEG